MALKKSDLRAILKNEDSTNEEKLSEILNMLHEEVDTVKDERDSIKGELDEAKAEITQLKDSADTTADEWKTKYEKINTEFEAYKNEQTVKATREAQEKAFMEALKEAGISEKMLSVIADTKKADGIISTISFDKDGKLEKATELSKQIREDYADYISKSNTEGTHTVTPPANAGSTLTKEEIFAIKDTSERQKAIQNNHELFGF